MKKLLLFGCSGNIGISILDRFISGGFDVTGVVRGAVHDKKIDSEFCRLVQWDVVNQDPQGLIDGKFDAVCWAQGANLNDSIYSFNAADHMSMYEANCLYILSSLSKIISAGFLAKKSKLCIISSIWQNIARQNKLSYSVTKSALQGMVNALSVDLGKEGHLINAILPGALDTQMTRKNLTSEQLNTLKVSTYFDRLATTEDIANLAYFLCGEDNNSTTGQFISVDLGFSNARIV